MALTKWSYADRATANSYINQTDATAFIADMPSSTAITAWNASAEKDQLLIRATQRVDMFSYSGSISYVDSKLRFPREGIYVDEVEVDSATVPNNIERATFEIALFMLENDINATNENINYKSASVGSIDVTFKDNQVVNPLNLMLTPFIKGFLKPYFKSSNSLGKN